MVRFRFQFQINSTFLSEMFFEGLLYLALNSLGSRISYGVVDVSGIREALFSLDDTVISGMKIPMTGNDRVNTDLFRLFNLNVKSRKSYSDLLVKIKENAEKLVFKDEVVVEPKISKSVMYIGVEDERESLALPQIFKIDRYTGFSSLETPYTSQQIKCRISKEVAVVLLLGLYSSFITVQRGTRAYYFLTLAPEEIVRALIIGDKNMLRNAYIIKELAKKLISNIAKITSINEALATELALNLKLREALREHNLDKISFILFKIVPEGQTYKIYEQMPITVHRLPPFIHTLSRFFRDPESIAEKLSKEFRSGSILLNILGNPNAEEHEDVVEAIIGLYRFVVLGDASGWYIFNRKIMDAYNKVKGSREAKGRARYYVGLLSKLAY